MKGFLKEFWLDALIISMHILQNVLTLCESLDSTDLLPLINSATKSYKTSWNNVLFAELMDSVEFATKKKRNCTPGKSFACGNSCQPLKTRSGKPTKCKKNHNPASQSAQKWTQQNAPTVPIQPGAASANIITDGQKLRDAINNKDYAVAMELSDGIYKRAKASSNSDNDFYIGMTAGNGGQDFILKQLYNELGFDESPQIISDSDFDAEIKKTKNDVLFRAVGSSRQRFDTHFNNFKQGDYFAGSGIYGHGTYVARARGGKNAIRQQNTATGIMSYGAGTMAMVIPKSKVIKDSKLQSELQSFKSGFDTWHVNQLSQLQNSGAPISEIRDFKKKLRRAKAVMYGDAGSGISGRFAVLKGYDAVDIGSTAYDQTYTILHNRSAVQVKENPWR